MLRPAALALVCSLALAAAAPSDARAEMEEWQVSLGPGYRGLVFDTDPGSSLHAPGLFVGGWYGVDDYWQLGASGALGVGLPVVDDGGVAPDPALVGSLTADVRYVLDIVEWVPHLGAAVGALWNGVGNDTPLDLIVGVGLGIDYRPARDWSLGLLGRFDVVLTDLDSVSAAYHVALVYSFHISDL